MGLLTGLLTLPVTGPARGAWWVLDQVVGAAEDRWYDEAGIVEELRSLHAALEDGRITERTYADAEDALMARLVVARERRPPTRSAR